jgi:hypothetical protein
VVMLITGVWFPGDPWFRAVQRYVCSPAIGVRYL